MLLGATPNWAKPLCVEAAKTNVQMVTNHLLRSSAQKCAKTDLQSNTMTVHWSSDLDACTIGPPCYHDNLRAWHQNYLPSALACG
jgi:hypothetical protein